MPLSAKPRRYFQRRPASSILQILGPLRPFSRDRRRPCADRGSAGAGPGLAPGTDYPWPQPLPDQNAPSRYARTSQLIPFLPGYLPEPGEKIPPLTRINPGEPENRTSSGRFRDKIWIDPETAHGENTPWPSPKILRYLPPELLWLTEFASPWLAAVIGVPT